MEHGEPISMPKFRHRHQPPCCGLAKLHNMLTCDKCWKPVFNYGNSSVPGSSVQAGGMMIG